MLRPLLTSCLDRLNGDNNDNMATNGEFALLQSYLRPGMALFDVGANLGEWTAQALRIQQSLRIYAFEPVPHIFDALQQRFEGDERLVSINMALADRAGRTEIYIDHDFSGSNSLFQRNIFSEFRKETVTLTTGDAFVAENGLGKIHFLKVDVEGAELKVLQGFRKAFEEGRIELCQLEYGGGYIDARAFLRDVFIFANELGYKVAKLLPRGLRIIESYDQTLESFKYANYLLYRDANLLPPGLALEKGK
jgi:FkbM family methyltransferase